MTEQIITLENGTRVAVVNRPHTACVTVAVFVNTGSQNETKNLNGISHFLEHMAFKGTGKRTCFEISSEVEKLGAEVNAYTSKENTVYYVTGLAKHVDIFIDLLSDILLNSIFPEDQIEQERQVILQEYNMRQDDVNNLTWGLYDKTSYGDSSYGRSVLGTRNNIGKIQRDDLINYTKSQYTGPNIIVGVAGNVDVEHTLKLVSKSFAGIANGTSHRVKSPQYLGGIGVKRKSAFMQTKVLLGFNAASTLDNYFADMVAANVLGGGMSSPLFNEIREKRGLCYGVGSGYSGSKNIGQFYISAGTSTEHLDEYFKAVCGVIKDHTQSINPIDLERAQNTLAVQLSEQLESRMSYLESIADDLFTFGKVQSKVEYHDRIMSVNEKDINLAINNLITSEPTIAIVGKGVDDKYLELVKRELR